MSQYEWTTNDKYESNNSKKISFDFQAKIKSFDWIKVSENDNEPSNAGNKEKLGHRRVDETGTVTYKRVMVDDLMKSLQIGLNYVLGKHHQPQRQVLLQDFQQIEYQDFPP